MSDGLRICFCLSCYWPNESGAERQAHRQAVELVKRGHRVIVLTRRLKSVPAVEELDGVEIRRHIRTIDNLGPAFGLSFLASLSTALWRMRKQVDVVHCHQALWEAAATGMVIRRMRGAVSVIQPAAGGEFGEATALAQTRGRRLLRRAILRNDHFVAISAQIEQELREQGVPYDNLTRIGSGVDTMQFSPGETSLNDSLPAGPRVLFLGRLHAQKNLHVLLRAWQLVVADSPTATLLLAGDGPQRDELVQLAEELNITDSVRFLGSIQNPEEYLRAAQVFVLASHAEGMSNSLLEAMSARLPIITSKAGGNTDLIQHERTGILADASQPPDLAAAITRLLDDRKLADQCGTAARQHIVDNYSIQAIVDRYVALYERLRQGA